MKRLFPILALVLLVGCEPAPHYKFTPPDDEAGRACIAECPKAEDNCKEHCAADKGRCEARAQDKAEDEYQSYAAQQERFGRTTPKTEGDFYGMYRCSSAMCEQNCGLIHRQCYTRCGGQVSPL